MKKNIKYKLLVLYCYFENKLFLSLQMLKWYFDYAFTKCFSIISFALTIAKSFVLNPFSFKDFA